MIGSFAFKRILMLLTALFCLTFGFEALAAPGDTRMDGIPYELEFDTVGCERLCYAGHQSSGVKYEKGYAVTPYTAFRVELKDGAAAGSSDVSGVGVSISLIYENDDKTSMVRETVRTYERGDIEDTETYYPLFDEINMQNLDDRGRLYNDSLSSIELKLSFKGLRGGIKEETFYLQVCSEEDLDEFIGG